MESKSKEDLSNRLQLQRWIFAKTMPKNPHYYTLKKNWKFPEAFEESVILIRKYGIEEKFRGWPYICFNFDGYKYWTMGSPVSQTILINRKPLEPFSDITTMWEYDCKQRHKALVF